MSHFTYYLIQLVHVAALTGFLTACIAALYCRILKALHAEYLLHDEEGDDNE